MSTLAIIGSGVAGLGCAWFLHREHDLTVFEGNDYIGGHTRTLTVEEEGRSLAVDTGFMVFNHATYPNLMRLFHALNVPTKRTDMSFSVSHPGRGLEYCGSSLNHLFAQRRNLLRPSFYRMLHRIDRFNREAAAAVEDPATDGLTLAEYVRRGNYGDDFLNLYLVPMSSALWSTPPEEMMTFPAATLLHFFHNHGFLGLHTQHPWWTVDGGAKTYVERLTTPFGERIRLRDPVRRVRRLPGGGVQVATDTGSSRFDQVILACHPPTALAVLGDDATSDERRVLAPFRYQPNATTLHTDAAVMPRTRLAWSAWNYRLDSPARDRGDTAPEAAPLRADVSTHYWMNRLQGVSERVNYFVSINGERRVDPAQVRATMADEHPLFDLPAVRAQPEIAALNASARGRTETYFAGAWQRYGFHEDGLLSAVQLSTLLLGRDAWLGRG